MMPITLNEKFSSLTFKTGIKVIYMCRNIEYTINMHLYSIQILALAIQVENLEMVLGQI